MQTNCSLLPDVTMTVTMMVTMTDRIHTVAAMLRRHICSFPLWTLPCDQVACFTCTLFVFMVDQVELVMQHKEQELVHLQESIAEMIEKAGARTREEVDDNSLVVSF